MIVVLLMLMWNLGLDKNFPQSAYASIPTSTPLPQALVRFEVEIPSDSPSGTGVELIVLDEVSGLMLNSKRYTMYAKDATHYQIELPLVVGSVVKYRYVLSGNSHAVEHNMLNQAVRYRLVKVFGAGMIVHDIVARWKESRAKVNAGIIKGKIVDENGKPIEGIHVYCGGYSTTSDKHGEFQIDHLIPGKHLLVAYAQDESYETFQQEAVIVSEKTTVANFSMKRVPSVMMVFFVDVPSNTPQKAQVRIAGNIIQLGNTFKDLPSGVSGNIHQMPVMKKVGENRFITAINLPIGAYIEYKYTLGNGYWNAERDEKGNLLVRSILVPSKGQIIHDEVFSWQDIQSTPYIFTYANPSANKGKNVFVKIFAYQWSEPLPMWQENDLMWTYTLFSPLRIIPKYPKVEFCVEDECNN